MSIGEFNVAHVTSGEEMRRVWDEAGQAPPGPEAWQGSIDAMVHEGFAVYYRGRARGSLLLRVTGVNPQAEPEVFEMIHKRYSETAQPGALQWLWTHPDYRQQGIGTALMDAGENRIVNLSKQPGSKTAPAAALTVRYYDPVPRNMYLRRQYEPVTGDLWESSLLHAAPVWEGKLGQWIGRRIRSFVMIKNLEDN